MLFPLFPAKDEAYSTGDNVGRLVLHEESKYEDSESIWLAPAPWYYSLLQKEKENNN